MAVRKSRLGNAESWRDRPVLKRGVAFVLVKTFVVLLGMISLSCGSEINPETQSLRPELHRTVAELCDGNRPEPLVRTPQSSATVECESHQDCVDGSNGRCAYDGGPSDEVPIFYCTYDACFSDDDCAPDEICICGDDDYATGGRYFKDENRCVKAGCKTDADCENEWCKAVPSPCLTGQIVGYECTTPNDLCRDDAECGGKACLFGSDRNAFFCGAEDCD